MAFFFTTVDFIRNHSTTFHYIRIQRYNNYAVVSLEVLSCSLFILCLVDRPIFSPLSMQKEVTDSTDDEDEAVQKLMFRINLILMEDGWSRPADNGSLLRNNSEPW